MRSTSVAYDHKFLELIPRQVAGCIFNMHSNSEINEIVKRMVWLKICMRFGSAILFLPFIPQNVDRLHL
jgi:hypothetical protein